MTVYLAIAKAFDTINYDIILLELRRMGSDSAFMRFFASYLIDRQHRVVISCGKSNHQQRWASVNFYSGSFFRLYKWPTRNNCQWVLFIRGWHKNVSTVDNKMLLEKNIENAIVGSKENRINFNYDKFKYVQFSLRRNQNKQFLSLPSNGFFLIKANQKLAYLNRSIPSEMKLSVKCNLVKTYIILILFYGLSVGYASKTIVRQMERLQRKSLKWIQSNSHFTDKEYNDCLRSVNLLPITYQLVFLDLLAKKLPLETEQFWQIINGHPKTRTNQKIFWY